MGSTSTTPFWNNIQFNQGLFGGNVAGLEVETAYDIIYAALRKAGVTLGPQRTPSPAQQEDGLEELGRLVGSLNCDRLFIFTIQILTLTLTAGKKVYTIGIDPQGLVQADFPYTRPQAIDQANVILTYNNPPIRLPVSVLTPQQWSSITLQDIPNMIPQACYIDQNWPIANLYVWGQPWQAMDLELYVWSYVQTFFQTTDVLVLPPGYNDALTLNLACRLAPHFQRIVDPDLRGQAREALMRVESLNAPRPILITPFGDGAVGRMNNYNIYSDQFYR